MKRNMLATALFALLLSHGFALEGYGSKSDEAQSWVLRAGLGLSLSHNLTWTDSKGSDGTTLMYGPGYSSSGQRPATPVGLLALGHHLNPFVDLSLELISLTRGQFKGQVNYPDSGNYQPVEASLRSTLLLAALRWTPYPKAFLSPYLSVGIGLSSNHCTGMGMSFPLLERPHTFSLPQGTQTSLAGKGEAGFSLRLNPNLNLSTSLMLLSTGRIHTEAGDGVLVRGDQIMSIPVWGTQSTRPLHVVFMTGLSWRPW